MIVLAPADRAALLDRVRRELDDDPRLAGEDAIDVPMVSQAWRADRL